MSKARKSVSLFMLLVLLFVFFTTASANSFIDTEEMILTPNVNPYEYSTSPDNLYVFLYRGYEPYLAMDIDTSACIEGRLYVFDTELNSVTEISSQPVTLYTCTKDALFYVTSAQEVYKTNYIGQNIEFLYQSVQGNISDFNNYLDNLYFIEDSSRIIMLNYNTGVSQIVWICDDLAWSFRLIPAELVAATVDENHYLLDITTGVASSIGRMTANEFITEAVTNASEASTPGISLMAYFSPSSILQENDVSLPLPEYPVRYGNTPNFQNGVYTDPISWFHIDGKEGCDGESNCKKYTKTDECEGFARYAHDRYLHNVAPDGTEYNTWFTTYPSNGRRELDSINTINNFFANLNTGDYVRYGNYGDSTPANGMHSIVFVNMDEGGIWAYECNQKYYDDLPVDRKDDHDADDFGCGIHLQYYTFENIKARYNYALYYVKHNYNVSPVYEDATYHKKECTHCVGYLRQKHDDVTVYDYVDEIDHTARLHCCGDILRYVPHTDVRRTIISTTTHRAVYLCCNYGETTGHDGTPVYSEYSSAQHSVRFTCCFGSVLDNHYYYDSSGTLVGECQECGYNRVPGAELNGFENVEIN